MRICLKLNRQSKRTYSLNIHFVIIQDMLSYNLPGITSQLNTNLISIKYYLIIHWVILYLIPIHFLIITKYYLVSFKLARKSNSIFLIRYKLNYRLILKWYFLIYIYIPKCYFFLFLFKFLIIFYLIFFLLFLINWFETFLF